MPHFTPFALFEVAVASPPSASSSSSATATALASLAATAIRVFENYVFLSAIGLVGPTLKKSANNNVLFIRTDVDFDVVINNSLS